MVRFTPVLLLLGCTTLQQATAPVTPYPTAMPAAGQVPDSLLRKAIHRAELVVLATPVALESQHGFLTPRFQLGAKETWYDVKLEVDSVVKGNLKRAKRPDLGSLPAWLTPPSPWKLRRNEIVVQYPAVTSRRSDWASAAPLVQGERAVFLFRRCYNCLPISGMNTGRGSYYKASPLIATGVESKLPPVEWPRVVKLLVEQRGR
jgi:hypothetical protein